MEVICGFAEGTWLCPEEVRRARAGKIWREPALIRRANLYLNCLQRTTDGLRLNLTHCREQRRGSRHTSRNPDNCGVTTRCCEGKTRCRKRVPEFFAMTPGCS